jgi:hypothetical protein
MKRFILLPFLLFFIFSFGQEQFVVPELTGIQKQWMITGQANGQVLALIGHAKSMGLTVQETAEFTGNQFKKSWDKEKGWRHFANNCLYNWTIFRPDNVIEILEQSETMLKFKSKIPFERLKNKGPKDNVSHKEYMNYVKINYKIIGEYMGASISFEDVEKGIVVTIKKK